MPKLNKWQAYDEKLEHDGMPVKVLIMWEHEHDDCTMTEADLRATVRATIARATIEKVE